METAAILIDFIQASHRINFLHNILSRPSPKLTKRSFEAQKKNPVKEDWCDFVQSDFTINLTKDEIRSKSKSQSKNIVKKLVKTATFCALQKLQSIHRKKERKNIRSNNF